MQVHTRAVLMSAILATGANTPARTPADSNGTSADSTCMSIFAPKSPLVDADPSDRHEDTRTVATRLVIGLQPDGLVVGVDSLSKEQIVISVGRNMIVAMKCDLYYYNGADRIPFGPCPGQVEIGLPNSPELELIKTLARRQGALQFVQELAFFETDIPPQHDWQPEQGRYRILWRGVATGFLRMHD